jgi:hypothetical protein
MHDTVGVQPIMEPWNFAKLRRSDETLSHSHFRTYVSAIYLHMLAEGSA